MVIKKQCRSTGSEYKRQSDMREGPLIVFCNMSSCTYQDAYKELSIYISIVMKMAFIQPLRNSIVMRKYLVLTVLTDEI